MSKYTKSLGDLLGAIKSQEESSGSNYTKADDSWSPKIDEDQEVADFVIRFLPNPDSETGIPWIERATHMCRFPNEKYIHEPCKFKYEKDLGNSEPTPCPICEETKLMFASQNTKEEEIAKKYYAKKRYIMNVLVVSDPRDNGVNEGKVKCFEMGKQIFVKCLNALGYEFGEYGKIVPMDDVDEEDIFNFHDPIDGADFKLKIVKKSGFPNYDKSKFAKVKPIKMGDTALTDKEIDITMEQCYKLNEKFLSESNFRSYEDLKYVYDNQGVYPKKGDKVTKETPTVDKDKEVPEKPPWDGDKEDESADTGTDENFDSENASQDQDDELAAMLN